MIQVLVIASICAWNVGIVWAALRLSRAAIDRPPRVVKVRRRRKLPWQSWDDVVDRYRDMW